MFPRWVFQHVKSTCANTAEEWTYQWSTTGMFIWRSFYSVLLRYCKEFINVLWKVNNKGKGNGSVTHKYKFPSQFANVFLTYQTFATNLHQSRIVLQAARKLAPCDRALNEYSNDSRISKKTLLQREEIEYFYRWEVIKNPFKFREKIR